LAALKSIKANHISLFQYILKHGYDLSDEELSELGKGLATAKERRKENYDFYIHTVCQKTGWNKEAALAAMDQAKELGISYLKYVQTACWEKDAEEVSELAEAVAEHKEEITDTKGNYIDKIMKATGWSYGKTELEVLKAKNLCGCSYEDYYVFRFYELSPKEQQAYVTLGMFNRMRIKYNDHTTAAKYFDDKAMFNRTFGDHIHRKWLVNDENLSYDDFLAAIQGLTSVIGKPLSLTQGQGIMKFSCNESEAQNRALYEEFMAMEESILEEYIVQHEAVAAFCPERFLPLIVL